MFFIVNQQFHAVDLTLENKVLKVAGKQLSTDDFQSSGDHQGLRARGTLKTDVGLGQVPNYPMASQSEAETGTSALRLMHPKNTKAHFNNRFAYGTSQPQPGDMIANGMFFNYDENNIVRKIGNSLIPVKNFWIKVSSQWKKCRAVYVKVNGQWKAAYGPFVENPEDAVDGTFFIWNGLVYGAIERNGLLWMDRNIGAKRVPVSRTDPDGFGDYYQWGRLSDGHERRNSQTTDVLSDSDIPGHNRLITATTNPWDWRSPQNHNLWKNIGDSPAPPGWRIPTNADFDQEIASWASQDRGGAYGSPLKFPTTGVRTSQGLIANATSGFCYTQDSIYHSGAWRGGRAMWSSSSASTTSSARGTALPVRCVKDLT